MNTTTPTESSKMDNLAQLAKQWRTKQATAEHARAALIDAVKYAALTGHSEYSLADTCQVTRQTIRTWLGK
jgi:hypothetical protein